jgi:hypothetical protein
MCRNSYRNWISNMTAWSDKQHSMSGWVTHMPTSASEVRVLTRSKCEKNRTATTMNTSREMMTSRMSCRRDEGSADRPPW